MANSTPVSVQTVNVVDWTSRVLAVIAIALSCLQFYQSPKPVTPPDNPPIVVTPPSSATVKAGHDHGIGLANSWADGVDAAAALAVPGALVADVIKTISTVSATNRTKDFDVKVKPILDALTPNGTLDATSAPKLQAALKDLSSGARGVK